MTIADLPGVPEATLSQEVAGRLPASTPAAPWLCQVEATVWWHRAAPGAAGLLPAGVRPGPSVAVAAFVRYLTSPVGPYDEVLACPHLVAGALRRGALARICVPFIAVDSLSSLAGGRTHWSLPKVPAEFVREGDRLRATGSGWSVGASARPRGPRLPLAGRLADTQTDAQGRPSTSVSRLRGTARAAAIDVTASSGLAGWLLPGRHPGLVLRGRLVVGAPR